MSYGIGGLRYADPLYALSGIADKVSVYEIS
jgi:hypothetical protein